MTHPVYFKCITATLFFFIFFLWIMLGKCQTDSSINCLCGWSKNWFLSNRTRKNMNKNGKSSYIIADDHRRTLKLEAGLHKWNFSGNFWKLPFEVNDFVKISWKWWSYNRGTGEFNYFYHRKCVYICGWMRYSVHFTLKCAYHAISLYTVNPSLFPFNGVLVAVWSTSGWLNPVVSLAREILMPI